MDSIKDNISQGTAHEGSLGNNNQQNSYNQVQEEKGWPQKDSISSYASRLNSTEQLINQPYLSEPVEEIQKTSVSKKLWLFIQSLASKEKKETVEKQGSLEVMVSTERDRIVKSLCPKLAEVRNEYEKDLKKNSDYSTRQIVKLTKKLEEELEKETLSWSTINRLASQIAILLENKKENNDQLTAQELDKMMEKEVVGIHDTYNTWKELVLGGIVVVLMGASGVVGATAGFGGLTSLITDVQTINNAQQLAGGLNSFAQGGDGVKRIVTNSVEGKRQYQQSMLERHRNHKSSTESQLNKNSKQGLMSQRERAIDNEHRARSQVLGMNG